MTTRTGLAVRCALVLGGVLLPARLRAQETTTLVGSVRDSAGHAVGGVEIRLNGGDLGARTNDAGGFRIAAVPVGHTNITVRRLGFAPASTDVTLRIGRIDSLVVSLTTVATRLPNLLVEDEATTRSKRLLSGFWERRSRGFGAFLTRDDIEARQATNFVDLVRLVPSTTVLTRDGRQTIRLKRTMGALRDCPPQYWVDGMRLESASPDEFSPEDVEAIEIYAGPSTLPVQFSPRIDTHTCGAIVIWTRLPGN
jgi:hypothetical protein